MNYLSLFSGVCGGDLAFQHLLKGFRCVGYVEYEKFCQDVIVQRIEDGLLDCAPVFGDIREFNREYAETYTGMVDLITAGFPCQPFSVTGKRKGENDERNMWPETIRTVRLVRPRYFFGENVPGLLASGYMPRIFADLAQAGYDARWKVLGADDVGARHRRKRLWILAYTNGIKRIYAQKRSNKIRLFKRMDAQKLYEWGCEPPILGRNNDISNRMDRLKAIGNGQVPQVAATAWEILS